MSHPSDDPRPSAPAAGKPTLEMLLRVKRAERPDAAFWADFERGFRQKQLAASIEPRPWWLGLSLLSRRFAPLALPVSAGAAALLAILVVRTQAPFGAKPGPVEMGSTVAATTSTPSSLGSDPGAATLSSPTRSAVPAAPAFIPPLAAVAVPAPASPPLVALAQPESPTDGEAVAKAEAEAPSSAPVPPVVAALLDLPAVSAASPTPSQLTIAQNLATVEAEEPGQAESVLTSATPAFARLDEARTVMDTTAADRVEEESGRMINPRHARLLAMAEDSASHRGDLAGVRERMVHRLAHDETAYGSSSRLAAAGDRFSLSF